MAYLRQNIIYNERCAKMTVAEMIKKTRTEANMTQEEYGAKFGGFKTDSFQLGK